MWQMDQDGHGFWLISMLDPKDNARIDITMMSPNHLQQILELKSNTAGLTQQQFKYKDIKIMTCFKQPAI